MKQLFSSGLEPDAEGRSRSIHRTESTHCRGRITTGCPSRLNQLLTLSIASVAERARDDGAGLVRNFPSPSFQLGPTQ